MANITTRADKGSALTHAEMDANFNNLNNNKVEKVTSTDNAIARFDGTTGTLQNTTAKIDDSGNLALGGISPPSYNTGLDVNYWTSKGYGVRSDNQEFLGGFRLGSSSSNSMVIFADPDNLRANTSIAFYVDGQSAANIDSSGVHSATIIADGQTWQDMSGSRSPGTTYTNTTGKPIMVSVYISGGNNSGINSFSIDGVVVGVAVSASAYTTSSSTTFIVPAGSAYKVDQTDSYTGNYWYELR